MLVHLKPYASTKDSGIPWLGTVPEHWMVRRLRDSTEGSINGIWGDEPNGLDDVLCVRVADFDRQRLRVRLTKPTMRAIAPSERRRRMLTSGNLLLEKSGGGEQHPVGVVVLYEHRVPAVCSNFVARLPVAAGFLPGFVTYLHSHLYAIRLNVRSIKQTTGIQNLDSSAYLAESVAFPPFGEQAALFRFLDHADKRIRRYIRAKQQLIKLLEEQKQVVIHRAVTRGLDPNIRLKASGVEWLGDMPDHWDLLPNRALLRLEKHVVGGAWSDYVLLSLTKRGIIARDMVNPEGKFPTSFDTYQVVNPGDLIFCLFDIDETPRAVGLSSLQGMITGAYTRFSCDPSTVEWVYLFYRAMDDGKCLKPLYSGLRKVITKSAFLSAKLPLPPAAERTAILGHVKESTRTADLAIERAQSEVQLLHEYRTRLIADVVTGKLDVREASARLPEATDTTDGVDGSEFPEEIEDADEDAELATVAEEMDV